MNQLSDIYDNYLIRPRLEQLLDKSFHYKITYLYAEMGVGKTTAVKTWAAKQKTTIFWITLKRNRIEKIKDFLKESLHNNSRQQYAIIIDNFHLLNESDYLSFCVKEMIDSSPYSHFVLLSQVRIMDGLKSFVNRGQLYLISSEELYFNKSEIREYYELKNFPIDTVSLNKICHDFNGAAINLNLLYYALKENRCRYNRYIYQRVKDDINDLIEREYFSVLTASLKKDIMRLALIDDFAEDLAIHVIGEGQYTKIYNTFILKTGFFVNDYNGHFRTASLFRDFVQNYYSKYLNMKDVKRTYWSTAFWYENKGMLIPAVKYCLLSEENHRAAEFLERLVIEMRGLEKYRDLEKYLLKLPQNYVLESFILTKTIIKICIFKGDFSSAKMWMDRLLQQADKARNEDRPAIEQQIFYSELMMPESNDERLYALLKEAYHRYENMQEDLNLNPYADIPSIIRGTKDLSYLCNWYLSSKESSSDFTSDPPVKKMLGRYECGSVSLAMSEYLYERNELNSSILGVSKILKILEQEGVPESIYTAYTIMSRILIAFGQEESAADVMKNAYKKLVKMKADWLLKNCRATMIMFSLIHGEEEALKNWLQQEAPDENKELNYIDLYQYVVKVKIYIYFQMYPQAITLAELLLYFLKINHRRLDTIECMILEAIAFDRIDDSANTVSTLKKAVELARDYRYVRVFADLGEPCYRLFIKYNIRPQQEDVYLRSIIDETKLFALKYPNFLKKNAAVHFELTKTEFEVLKLLERSMSNAEIAEFLDISLDTVKFHNKNIFSKLNVKNRLHAVKVAKELKLLK